MWDTFFHEIRFVMRFLKNLMSRGWGYSYFVTNGKNEGFLPARGRKNNPESPALAPRLEGLFFLPSAGKNNPRFFHEFRTLFFPIE